MRSLHLAALLAALLVGCPQQPPTTADQAPRPAATPAVPAALADPVLQPLAAAMVTSGQTIGQMVANGARAAAAPSLARTAFTTAQSLPGLPFPIPSGIMPSGLPGVMPPAAAPWSQFWQYRDGWYWSQFNTAQRQLRFRFERADGSTVDWDVTDPAQYGPPPKRTAFPAELVKFHTEYDQTFPLGIESHATCYGDLPPGPPTAATRIPQTGQGQVRNVPTLGTIDYTVAADANGAATEVKGQIVHTVRHLGATYVGTCGLSLDGPVPPATITRDGQKVADLQRDGASGPWTLTAEGRTIPVAAMGLPGL